jgi:hypothetical protein
MVAMRRSFLRHWTILDLDVFRQWLTDDRIKQAHVIDNHDRDQTRGLAWELNLLPDEMFIEKSDTMKLALEFGLDAIEPLPSAPPRRLRPPPDLQELVARHGGYDRIPAWAHAEYDCQLAQWKEDVRLGLAEIPAETKK